MRAQAKSSSANGRSAPSRRTRLSLIALAIAALALLAFVPLAQAKVVAGDFGAPYTYNETPWFGGMISNPAGDARGIAVNDSGVGAPAGTFYVVDPARRVHRFAPTGAFERVWGQDVVSPFVDEQQVVSVRASGGAFTLSFGGSTTGALNHNVSTSGLDNALDVLPSIGGDANVSVDDIGDSYYIITFTGALGAGDQPQLTADTSQLTGSAAIDISTLADGSNATGGSGTGFEICTVADHCKAGSTSGTTANGGQLNDPQGVAINQATGDVYVTEQGNRRVSEFDAHGNFVRAWGWDVVMTGGTGDVSTNDFEVCTVAAECKQGTAGANGGQFGTAIGYPVTDASGNVWVPDAANERIQKFDSTGSFIAAYGHDVDVLGGGGALEECTSTVAGACRAGTNGSAPGQFSANSPTQIAFDSSGNLYALDGGSNDRVQRFDPTLLASVTEFAAATLANYTTQAPESIAATTGGNSLAFAVQNNISGGGERQIVELDPTDASVTDASLVGSAVGNLSGLAEEAASGDLYATGVPVGSNARLPGIVLSDTPAPAPVLTMQPVADPTDTTATFSASIDPQGRLVTNCKFEYSADQVSWTPVPEPNCAPTLGDRVAPDGGAQAVGEKVAGLAPNSHYFVRLSASRPLVPGSTTTSLVIAFNTDSVPPVVSDLGAIQVTDTSARLVGTIDPRNSVTGYVFQYGTTPALGSSTEPVAIGGGVGQITVSQVVGGLRPDTTYYFKLFASNEFGSTPTLTRHFTTRSEPPPPANPGNCPNEALRQAQATEFLPDCRAYEMVSPPDKNQGGVDQYLFGEFLAAKSRDGNAAMFCTNASFAGTPVAGLCAPYLSKRTGIGPTGWQTTSPFPAACRRDTSGWGGPERDVYLSPNFDRAAVKLPESSLCPTPPLDPSAPEQSANLYRQDLTTDPFGFELLNIGSAEDPGLPLGQFALASDDFSHVVYLATTNQTLDSPAPGNFTKIYDWEEEGHGGCVQPRGCLSLVSKDTGGAPFTTASGIPEPIYGAGSVSTTSAVSTDGDRIYFQNGSGAGRHVYMRENGAVTHDVSAPECTVSCGANLSADHFLWASPAGDVALFLSCDRLTDASAESKSCSGSFPLVGQGWKLYRWDRDAPPGNRLTDMTVDQEPGDGVQPNVLGVVGASDDGEVVYLITGGQGDSGGQIAAGGPTEGGMMIFRVEFNGGLPVAEYLGSYVSKGLAILGNKQGLIISGSLNQDLNVTGTSGGRLQVTPDGEQMMITTPVALDSAADRDEHIDAYRWSEVEGWICVSCQLPGAPSAGDVDNIQTRHDLSSFGIEIGSAEPDAAISDDGLRVFFTTRDALVPGDMNGEAGCPRVRVTNGAGNSYACQDIYQWHDGTLSLITPGTGSDGYVMVGATRDGESVFFITLERLLGWDTDNGRDIYVARVGGGFPEPAAQPPACEGEACRGPGSVAPPTTGAGSREFVGPPDPIPQTQKPCPRGKRRVVRNGRTRCVAKKRKRQNRAAKHNRRAAR